MKKFSLEHDHLINILLKKVKEKIRYVCLDLTDYYHTLKEKKKLKKKILKPLFYTLSIVLNIISLGSFGFFLASASH